MLLEQQLKTVERVLEMRIIPQVQIYARIRNHGCHHHIILQHMIEKTPGHEEEIRYCLCSCEFIVI